jgi:hypothetical protein
MKYEEVSTILQPRQPIAEAVDAKCVRPALIKIDWSMALLRVDVIRRIDPGRFTIPPAERGKTGCSHH